eukprot:SAG11_NODE_13290_length_661_cov_1.551601_2_plen_26_part_01
MASQRAEHELQNAAQLAQLEDLRIVA